MSWKRTKDFRVPERLDGQDILVVFCSPVAQRCVTTFPFRAHNGQPGPWISHWMEFPELPEDAAEQERQSSAGE